MKAINKRRCQNLGFYLVVTLMVLYCVLPFLWQLFTSFKYDRDINLIPPIIPDELTLDHYKNVFAFNNFGYYVRNSIIVSSVTTIVSLIVGAFCAYAMSRLRFKGKGVVMVLTLTASMFPQIAIVSTLYIIFRSLAILNTFYPMMISNMIFTLPLTIWILTSFFRSIPISLEEAALIDGLNRRQILFKVFLPIAAREYSPARFWFLSLRGTSFFSLSLSPIRLQPRPFP